MSAQNRLSPVQFEHFHDETGGAISAMHQDTEVGSLDWNRYSGGPPVIGSVNVSEPFRRQGIATEMYRRASDLEGQPLQHSHERTDMGDAWAHTVGGEVPDRTVVTMRGAEKARSDWEYGQ